MLKKISAALLSFLSFSLFSPFTALAASSWDATCRGTGDAEDVATLGGINCLVPNVLSIAFSLLAFGGFIMLIVSGVKLMLAGSDAQGARKAAASIRNVVIGLVLALGSFFIIQLISSLTGVTSILTLRLGD